jgi:hypothetical protein
MILNILVTKQEDESLKVYLYCNPLTRVLIVFVKFQVLTASSIKFRVFWYVVPCSHEVDTRFRGAYCLHHRAPVTSVPPRPQLTGIVKVTHRGPAKGRFLSCLTLTLYFSLSSTAARPPACHLPASSPDRHPFPNSQPKFHLDRRFLYNLLSLRARLIHRPDDGSSIHL